MRRGDAELLRRPSSSILARRPAPRRCARTADQRMVRHVARLRDERLLVGIAVRDERAVGRDDQREAVLADADAVDHPPHFLEAELADQPAGGLVEARQVDGEDASSAAGRRRRGSATSTTPSSVDGAPARESATRGWPTRLVATGAPASSNSVISRNSRNCEDVVLEDAVLLPRLQAGVLQVGGERLQDARRWSRRSGGSPRRRAWRRSGCRRRPTRACRAAARGARRRRRRAAARRPRSARSSAKRVAMWRMLKRHAVSVAAGGLAGRPAARGAACARMSRPGSAGHVEARADRARALAPGEEDRRRIVDDGPLKRRDAGPVLVVGRGVADRDRARRRRLRC